MSLSRRALLLAVPQVVLDPFDPWQRLERVWNPFAARMNQGVLDLKLWKKVVAAVDAIEDRKCR